MCNFTRSFIVFTLVTVRTAVSTTFEQWPSDPYCVSCSFKRNKSETLGCFLLFFFVSMKRANLWNENELQFLQFLHHGYCICLVYYIGSARMWVSQTESKKQKNMQETFNKVKFNKPPRVNVYEQFHPVKIIKLHLIPPKNMPQVTIL